MGAYDLRSNHCNIYFHIRSIDQRIVLSMHKKCKLEHTMTPITLQEKIVAFIKGDILGRVLTEKEYYYLMFRCETEDEISLIKSMTSDECRFFLDACWYFGIEHTNQCQLEFMKVYRKYSHIRKEGK